MIFGLLFWLFLPCWLGPLTLCCTGEGVLGVLVGCYVRCYPFVV